MLLERRHPNRPVNDMTNYKRLKVVNYSYLSKFGKKNFFSLRQRESVSPLTIMSRKYRNFRFDSSIVKDGDNDYRTDSCYILSESV